MSTIIAAFFFFQHLFQSICEKLRRKCDVRRKSDTFEFLLQLREGLFGVFEEMLQKVICGFFNVDRRSSMFVSIVDHQR